jgi:hypothetical protein
MSDAAAFGVNDDGTINNFDRGGCTMNFGKTLTDFALVILNRLFPRPLPVRKRRPEKRKPDLLPPELHPFLAARANVTIRRLIPLFVLACCLGSADCARAGVSYTYASDQINYSAASGTTVTVFIYLNENLTGASTSIEAANSGLQSAGWYVVRTGGDSSGVITSVAANKNPNDPGNPGQPNDGFDGGGGVNVNPQVATDGSAARLRESTNDLPGPVGATTYFGTQLLLGTVTIKAGALGTSTTFTLQTYKNAPTGPFGGSGTDGNTVDYGPNDYDVSGFDSATSQSYTGANDLSSHTFTVTAVPEPGSLLFCGLTVCGGACAAYRRHKGVRASL